MADAAAEEKVNIEHLLVEAMHNMPEDPLPSAEEIAWAKAAAATAHSTCSAAVAAQPVRGLGGAGLGLNRKGRSKAGNSSTISAATAPPALLLNPPGGRGAAPNSSSKLGRNRPGEPAAPAAAINSSASATTATRNASEAAVAAANAAATNATCGSADPSFSSGGVSTPTPDVSRSYNNNSKYAAGVRSFRTALSPDSEADGSSEWESASQDEVGGWSGSSCWLLLWLLWLLWLVVVGV